MIIKDKQIESLRNFDRDRLYQKVQDSINEDEPDLLMVDRLQSSKEFTAQAVDFGLSEGLMTVKQLVVLTTVLLSHLSHFDEWENVLWICDALSKKEPGKTKLNNLIEYDAALNCGWN